MYIKFQLIFRWNRNIGTVLTFTNHFNCSLYSNGLTHLFTVQRKVYSQLQKFVPNVRKNISLCPRGGFRGETDVTSLSTFLDNLVTVNNENRRRCTLCGQKTSEGDVILIVI